MACNGYERIPDYMGFGPWTGACIKKVEEPQKGDAHLALIDRTLYLLGCSGDLVSRLSTGPYGASYGLLGGLIGDTRSTS